MSAALVCPVCSVAHGDLERFCATCGLPLVHGPGVAAAQLPNPSRLAERARKVRPGYAEGPLVRVASARHQAEADLVQGLLLEEGIPSLARRSGGFDVPDFLASGPRDILVPASGAEAAREILGDRRPPGWSESLPSGGAPLWVRALAVALAVVLLATVAAGALGAAFF